MLKLEWLKKPVFWLLLVLALVWVAIFSKPDQKLHLVFCPVGQGDAALIIYGSSQILVDGGPDNQVLNCLGENLPFYDRKIEMVILTHPDADHLTGLIAVLERYEIGQLILNSVGKDSGVFKKFAQAVEVEKAPLFFPQEGDRLTYGPLVFDFLWPENQGKVLGATALEKEVNDTSLVFLLSFGEFDAFFPGDISAKVEQQLELTDIELLKVAHHGSKFSTSEEFLKQTQPELAIVSVGENSFGHPAQEVLTRLNQQKTQILRTDRDSPLEIITDGKNWGRKNSFF